MNKAAPLALCRPTNRWSLRTADWLEGQAGFKDLKRKIKENHSKQKMTNYKNYPQVWDNCFFFFTGFRCPGQVFALSQCRSSVENTSCHQIVSALFLSSNTTNTVQLVGCKVSLRQVKALQNTEHSKRSPAAQMLWFVSFRSRGEVCVVSRPDFSH